MQIHYVCDSDYVLVPLDAYVVLEKIYGGGPRIVRNVVAVPNEINRLMVEVQLVRLQLYSCSQEGIRVQNSTLVSRYMTVKDLRSKINVTLDMSKQVPGTVSCRLWYRITDEAKLDTSSGHRVNFHQITAYKSTRGGRRLTSDVTETDGSWTVLRVIHENNSLWNFIGENLANRLEILVEFPDAEGTADTQAADKRLKSESSLMDIEVRGVGRVRLTGETCVCHRVVAVLRRSRCYCPRSCRSMQTRRARGQGWT